MNEGEEAELVQAVHTPCRCSWWGQGAKDVLQPGLSAGLMADAFCLLVRLGMYNSTICKILGHTQTRTRTHAEEERQTQETEMKWLLKAKEGSDETGAAGKAAEAGSVAERSQGRG